MYLLDTNHCSLILDGDSSIEAKLAALGDTILATSVIVAGELSFMVENSERRDENKENIDSFLDEILMYSIDKRVANLYGVLKAGLLNKFASKERKKRRQWKLGKLGISDNDLWIAATALAHDLTIVSRDKDFTVIAKVAEIRTESWIV